MLWWLFPQLPKNRPGLSRIEPLVLPRAHGVVAGHVHDLAEAGPVRADRSLAARQVGDVRVVVLIPHPVDERRLKEPRRLHHLGNPRQADHVRTQFHHPGRARVSRPALPEHRRRSRGSSSPRRPSPPPGRRATSRWRWARCGRPAAGRWGPPTGPPGCRWSGRRCRCPSWRSRGKSGSSPSISLYVAAGAQELPAHGALPRPRGPTSIQPWSVQFTRSAEETRLMVWMWP